MILKLHHNAALKLSPDILHNEVTQFQIESKPKVKIHLTHSRIQRCNHFDSENNFSDSNALESSDCPHMFKLNHLFDKCLKHREKNWDKSVKIHIFPCVSFFQELSITHPQIWSPPAGIMIYPICVYGEIYTIH